MFEQFIVEFLEEKPTKRKRSDEVTFSFSSIYLFHYILFNFYPLARLLSALLPLYLYGIGF